MIKLEDLAALDSHWAIQALPGVVRQRALEVTSARLVQSAVPPDSRVAFESLPGDDDRIEQVATAYELAAAEGIQALLHPGTDADSKGLAAQAQAAAFRVYEMRRALPTPNNPEARVFHVLHLAAVAYCAERWADQRRWFKEHPQEASPPSVTGAPWDLRVLYRLFEGWVRLVRKDGWDDLEGIATIIAELRKEQKEYEAQLLTTDEALATRYRAYRLIALYHWARATELLSVYMLQGTPIAVAEELDKHFENGREAAHASDDAGFDVLLRWMHVAARQMVAGSIWSVVGSVNSRITELVQHMVRNRGMFELLPPQRVALQQEGLLDTARKAVVVELPTSGGKTALAEFRLLQALNQFDKENGWVAYVAPTRALVSQITRRLREDLAPVGIKVEQLSGALEMDGYEEALLAQQKSHESFDVLVSTPEKLQFVIRNKTTPRPLALIILDEAHNLENKERGLRIELLLATVRRDCPRASFLLLMPFVPNAHELANWLAPESGLTISLQTSAWQPNERVVGVFGAQPTGSRGDWTLEFETLTTTPRTINLRGRHQVGGIRPLPMSFSQAAGSLSKQTAAMAGAFASRGTSIAVARTTDDAWSMARELSGSLDPLATMPSEIALVQRFLATEISPAFELIKLLGFGIGVHHAGLSDETRSLIEWLAEIGSLRVLCATTTIAQGINFPVSSVFLASRQIPTRPPSEMTTRDFWNLAGRAGRLDQGTIGFVGLAAGNDRERVARYVSAKTGELVSRLLTLLEEVEKGGELANLDLVIRGEQWTDFRSYIAHLWGEKRNLDAVLGETEQMLRNTLGYSSLQRGKDPGGQDKAKRLLEATKEYARSLSTHPENAILADATGFSPEGVRSAILGLKELTDLGASDWKPDSLFGPKGGTALTQLIGVMMRVPQLQGPLADLRGEGPGATQVRIAELAQAWVGGATIEAIARQFFGGSTDTPTGLTEALSSTCKAIYRTLTNFGTWGLASLSKLPTAGIQYEELTLAERRQINNLPAMLYYGVHTEAAVLMRMQSIPRSVAETLGQVFIEKGGAIDTTGSPYEVRDFIKGLTDGEWDAAIPTGAAMSGDDYKQVWSRLTGEHI